MEIENVRRVSIYPDRILIARIECACKYLPGRTQFELPVYFFNTILQRRSPKLCLIVNRVHGHNRVATAELVRERGLGNMNGFVAKNLYYCGWDYRVKDMGSKTGNVAFRIEIHVEARRQRNASGYLVKLNQVRLVFFLEHVGYFQIQRVTRPSQDAVLI